MYPYLMILGHQIPTYGLCMTLGIVVSFLCANQRAIKSNLSTDHLLIIGAASIGCAIIGAKVLYIFVSFSPSELFHILTSNDLPSILERGFVFYGGLLGGIGGAFLGARIANTTLYSFEQSIVPFLPLGYGIGRIGCFLAGCCYGRAFFNTSLPVPLLDAAISFFICNILVKHSVKSRPPYSLLFTYLIIYSVQRFILEFLRGDIARGFYMHFSTSQWISIFLFVFSIVTMLVRRNKICKQENN